MKKILLTLWAISAALLNGWIAPQDVQADPSRGSCLSQNSVPDTTNPPRTTL